MKSIVGATLCVAQYLTFIWWALHRIAPISCQFFRMTNLELLSPAIRVITALIQLPLRKNCRTGQVLENGVCRDDRQDDQGDAIEQGFGKPVADAHAD